MATMSPDRNMVISFKTFISKNDDSTKVVIFENVIERWAMKDTFLLKCLIRAKEV
jgi:hypothetical protein